MFTLEEKGRQHDMSMESRRGQESTWTRHELVDEHIAGLQASMHRKRGKSALDTGSRKELET